MTSPVIVALLTFVIASAVATALLKDVVSAVIASGAYSLGMSILWVVFQAPDVGLTEAAVGAGVLTLLYILTIAKTARSSPAALFERIRLRRAALVGLFALALLSTVSALPPVGAEAPVPAGEVTQYYLTHAYDETGVTNAVTAILVAYRGFDTLGEAIVVFAAGVAVLVVFRRSEFT